VIEDVIHFGMRIGLARPDKLRRRMDLIPRYNWDYGTSDFFQAIRSILRKKSDVAGILEKTFGQKPIFTTSGRTSLYAILKSMNLRDGSHVGVPLFCCSVVFDAIQQAKLVPRFIDIDLIDYNISASDLRAKMERLAAVVVVHMFGHPADMDAISEVCRDIPIVEDCAQSLYSLYKGRYTGFSSIASFFSFRSGKYISAGEGSVIFCSNPSSHSALENLVERFEKKNVLQELQHCSATLMKSLFYKRPLYGLFGYTMGRMLDKRLNLSAKTGFKLGKIAKSDSSVIRKKLPGFINAVNNQRQNSLSLLQKIQTQAVILPLERNACVSNYFQFAIRFRSQDERDFVAERLLKKGIDSAKYLDEIVDWAKDQYGYRGDCPNAELSSKTVLVIPNHYTLSESDLNYIADSFNEVESELDKLRKKT